MPKYQRNIVRVLGLFLILGFIPLSTYIGLYVGDDLLLILITLPICLSWFIMGIYGMIQYLPLTKEEQDIVDKQYEEGLIEELEEMGYTILPLIKLDNTKQEFIKEILSKYGTTPQKKRTEQEIRNMYYYTSSQNNDYNINDTLAPGIIITFLRKVGLLQE